MTILFPSWLFGYAGPRGSTDAALKVPDNFLPAGALKYYATPGIPPPSARVDPKLKLQPRRPVRLWHWWKYGLLVATKGPSYFALPLQPLIPSPQQPRSQQKSLPTIYAVPVARHGGLR